MGSLQLDCPLCCSETFPCHNSLKYHLLSITDNLNCPVCRKKFEQVFELAMHIGRKCDDEEDLLKDGNKCEEEEDSLTDGRKCEDEEDPLIEERKCEDEDDLLTDGNKCEIEEDPLRDDLLQPESNENVMEETSILAKALMQPTTNSMEIEIPCGDKSDDRVEELNEDLTEADTYFCSSCTINFYSVEDHIAEFHQGDEVFFKPEQEDEEETEASSFLINDDTNENETGDITNSDELLDTVTEEECIDKDGRFYTRKVVKIEKFWDKTLTNTTTEVPLQFYQCIKCKVKFKSIELFYKHSCATNETQIDNFKYKRCKICNSCFVSSHFLNVHMKTHKNKPVDILEGEAHPPFVCETCNTTFPSFKSLRLHKRMHEPIKSKNIDRPVNYDMLGERLQVEETAREMFVCEICNKAYDKEYEEVHKKFHSKESDFNCETCNRKFFSLENLNMHMKAHVDTKKFVCSYCKKGFLTQEKLDAHMLTKCQFRQYECQYCGRRFARPHEKVKHERIHTGEKPHKCEICGKAFRVSYCLTLHMRTHSGTRPYKCDHCGKRFKAHSVYNHHLLTHSDDRKYKCPFCPKTFKTGVQLAGHKNSHTKPFTCTKCHRPFASLYAVRAHMDTHERQNNLKYQCILCGATYARAFALRDHVKEQHPEEEQQVSSEINIDNITILDSEDYSNVETHSAVLPDGEHILIDVGTDDVESITI